MARSRTPRRPPRRAPAPADWPGNIPQLHATLAQLQATTAGAVISAEMVQRALGAVEARVLAFDEARDEFTRSYVAQLLQLTRGNVSQAARLARRNRTDFYKLLARHEMSPEAFKGWKVFTSGRSTCGGAAHRAAQPAAANWNWFGIFRGRQTVLCRSFHPAASRARPAGPGSCFPIKRHVGRPDRC